MSLPINCGIIFFLITCLWQVLHGFYTGLCTTYMSFCISQLCYILHMNIFLTLRKTFVFHLLFLGI